MKCEYMLVKVIPRDGLVIQGKTFVDESMMTGETNPIFKEKDDHVIGGTRIQQIA